MTAAVSTGHDTTTRDPGLRDAVAAEWTKLRTASGPRRNLVLGTVLGIVTSLLLAALVGATFDEWSAQEQADFDPTVYPLSGSLLMTIFYVAASVGAVTSEYRSGMVRPSLTAVPNRARFLAAKVIVVTAAVWLASAVAISGMLFGSQLIFAASDLPTAGLADGDFLRTFAVLIVTGPLFPVLSVVAGFLLRTSAASVTTMLAIIFLPSMFGGVLPGWWQRNVLSLLPGNAADSLALGHLADSEMYLRPLPAALVVLAWIAGALLVTYRVLVRRDA